MRGSGEKRVGLREPATATAAAETGEGERRRRAERVHKVPRWPSKGLKAAGPDGPDPDSNRPIMFSFRSIGPSYNRIAIRFRDPLGPQINCIAGLE